ncbi:MAG: hypothetical protein Q9166_007092 [cf. Caloplaca sp. 2 TL-2023]
MLEFLYTQTYNLNKSLPTMFNEKDRHIQFAETNIALYTLGDKYAIFSLCSHAANCFDTVICDRITGADTDVALGAIPSVYAAAPENDRTLRDMVVGVIAWNMKSIARRPKLKELFLVCMHQIEQFREDMSLALLDDCKIKHKDPNADNSFDSDSSVEFEKLGMSKQT